MTETDAQRHERYYTAYRNLEYDLGDLGDTIAVLDQLAESFLRPKDGTLSELCRDRTGIKDVSFYCLTPAQDRALHSILNQVARQAEALEKVYHAPFDKPDA